MVVKKKKRARGEGESVSIPQEGVRELTVLTRTA